MRWNGSIRWNGSRLARVATLLASFLTLAGAASADLRYVQSFGLIPNPPHNDQATTLVVYGTYPTRCGVVEEATVIDTAHVALRIRSGAECPPDTFTNWVATFPLGMLARGNHTVSLELTMDHPDSGVAVYSGSFTFGVEGPSDDPPPPPPPPPSDLPLLSAATTEPQEPRSDAPVALIVSGYAPFGCPVVESAAIIDTSHLALTLTPRLACSDSDTTRFWSHRFELGVQREGHHFEDLAITLQLDLAETFHLPVHFLVYSADLPPPPPPSDSLPRVLSRSRPNPFSVESRFSVTLDDGVAAEVSVFDVTGRKVRTVFRGHFAAGTTELAWDGRRDDGRRANAGIYFYRLILPGRVLSTRLVLLPQP